MTPFPSNSTKILELQSNWTNLNHMFISESITVIRGMGFAGFLDLGPESKFKN